MRKRTLFPATLLIIAACTLLSACKQQQVVTVDPLVLLSYGKQPDAQNLENLAKNYSSVINKNRKSNVKQPGLFADYAVAMAILGRRSEANSWFNREMADFPSSRTYILRLKQQLIPEYINDNTISVSDTASGGAEALSPAARRTAEQKASEVMSQSEDNLPPDSTFASPAGILSPESPEAPENPEAPESPETQDGPETPETPENSVNTETPESPETPEKTESHETL